MEGLWPPNNKRISKSIRSKTNYSSLGNFADNIIPYTKNIDKLKNNRKTAFVILTRHTGRELFKFNFYKENKKVFIEEFPDVISSVERIRKYYPDNQIIIIDANSPNKQYQSIVKDIDKSIIIEDIENKNYESGGIIYAFKKYKDHFESFFFLQDSILLTNYIAEVDTIKNDNIWYSIQECNTGWCHRSDKDYSGRWILDTKCKFNIRDSCVFKDGRYNPIFIGDINSNIMNEQIVSSYDVAFPIAYCCSFLVHTETFQKILNTNILKNYPLPYNKISNCAWERLWALAFYEIGAKVRFFNNIEIIYWYGDAAGDKGANYTNKFIKFYLGRK